MAENSLTNSSTVRSETKLMAKHGLIYGLGNMFNKVIGFLLLPIYTRYLIPADYGTLEMVAITTEIIGMLLSMRISRAMYRFYFEYDSAKDKNQVVSTAIIAFGGIGLAGLAFASVFSNYLSDLLLNSSQYWKYFAVSFCTLWFNTIVMMGFDYIQIQKKSIRYITMSSLRLLLGIVLNVYFIVFLNMGVMGVLLGNLISGMICCAIIVFPILSVVGLRFSKIKLFEMLNFGLPLIPGAIANFVVLVSDRYFLKVFNTLSDIGIYSLSYKFGTLPHTFVTVPFFNIWSVRRFELLKQEGAEERMGKVITYFLFLLVYIGLGLSVLAKDTIQIMADQKYWDAHKYIPILALSYIIFGLFNHFAVNILIEKKTKYISYIDLTNGALNIVLNIVLIGKYGIWGAAFATLISYTLRIVVLYYVSSRMGKIYFEFTRAFKILSAASIIYGFSLFIDLGNAFINFGAKSLYLMTFPFLLFCLSFYKTEELRLIQAAWSQKSFTILLGR